MSCSFCLFRAKSVDSLGLTKYYAPLAMLRVETAIVQHFETVSRFSIDRSEEGVIFYHDHGV